MWSDRVSNPGLLALKSDVLPTALRGPAILFNDYTCTFIVKLQYTVDSRYLEVEGTLKYFVISVLRHIRCAVLRKIPIEQPKSHK